MTTPISQTRENAILLLFGVAGLIVFLILFPRAQPSASIGIEVDRNTALQIAETFLSESMKEPNTIDFTNRSVNFQADNRLTSFLSHIEASQQERALLINHSAPYYWDVTLANPSEGGTYFIKVSVDGIVFECTYRPPDAYTSDRLTPPEAEREARDRISQLMPVEWDGYSRVDANSVDVDERTEHTFTWRTDDAVAGKARHKINATVIGNRVVSWGRSIEFPRTYNQFYTNRNNTHNLTNVSQVILSIFLWVVALFVFAFRFRASEVSWRNGLVVTSLLLLVLVVFWTDSFDYLSDLGPDDSDSGLSQIIIYINLGLQLFFMCFGVFFIWMSGESLSRDIWPARLRAIDGLFARQLFSPDLGRAILRGFSLGLGQLGIWYVLLFVVSGHPDVWPTVGFREQQLLTAHSPSLFFIPISPISDAISSAILLSSYAAVFVLSLMQKITGRRLLAVLLPWIVFYGIYADTTVIFPQWMTAIAGLISGILFFVFFFRYDLLTVMVGTFVYALLPTLFLYLHQPTTSFTITGSVGLVFVTGLFVYGLVARLRGKVLDETAIVPAYARNITERQRLKLELDVARRAQLQMLPRSIPQPTGLDIAAFTVPAREVGGDYFDFFELSDNKIGFAVGDVSGKGMPAALYMTLLKGSLQSQATRDTSPRTLLSHINRTFYQTAERNTFVTLLYGIIDLQQSALTFSRAGHNPIVIYRSSNQTLFFLKPPGLGIGLEKGDVFDRVLAEESFGLIPGDIIVVYTDGLTEARNLKEEEFGEDRLNDIIKSHPVSSAEDLLQRIKDGYHAFTGRAEPHDDLTCLIIRVQ